MERKNKLVVIGVIVVLVLITGVAIWLNFHASPMVFKPTTTTPKSGSVPTLWPQAKTVNDPYYSIIKQTYAGKTTILLRLFTVGKINQNGDVISGSGYFPWDNKHRVVEFDLKGRNGNYFIGVCQFGVMCDYAYRIDSLTYDQISNYVPHGSMIQVKINTDRISASDKATLNVAVEAGLGRNWRFEDLTLHPFEWDIILQ